MRTIRLMQKICLGVGLATLSPSFPWLGATSGIATTAILISASPAQAAVLSYWKFDAATQELEITVPGGTIPRYFLAAEPARIVLDLPDTQLGAVPLELAVGGAVKQIRVAQFQPDLTRIVLELAPGTVLAPGQVNLERLGGGSGAGDRWVLRPLLAGSPPPVAAEPLAAPSPAGAVPAATPIPSPADRPPAVAPTSAATRPSPADLPPLEPGATEIPVARSAAASVDLASAPAPAATPQPQAPDRRSESAPAPESPAAEPDPPEAAPAVPSVANAPLPPVVTPTDRPPIRVPDLDAAAAQPAAASLAPPALPAAPVVNETVARTTPEPVASPFPAAGPAVASPAEAANSSPAISAAPPTGASAGSGDAIEFGQPIPTASSAFSALPAVEPGGVAPAASQSEAAIGVIAEGTVLTLRYPGETPLALSAEQPHQEVLLLDRDVLDQAGNVILPANSQVIGRFETGKNGSQFVAQAISVQGRNLLLNAESAPISSGRQVSNSLLRNAGLGALAGTLLGGITGIGILAGIAAGAATSAAGTYITAPQAPVIQPNQIVEVRLLQAISQ